MTRINRLLLLCLSSMAVVVSGQVDEGKLKVTSTGFALANNHFGLNLLNKLSEENEKQSSPENLFFSPYSISLAMAMLYQGTGGSTAQQLESSLGYQEAKLTGKSAITQQIKESDNSILVPQLSTASYNLSSGNALIANKQFQILENYTQSLKDNFRAELFSVDFNNEAEAATNLINQWVSNRTNRKIEKVLKKPLPSNTQFALVNAVYFKGSWKSSFNPERTLPDTFNGLNGAKYENVSFMNINGRFNLTKLNEINSTLLELPYVGEDLSMYAILPNDEKSDLKLIKQKLTPSFIDSSISQKTAQSIRLQFPKFNFKTTYDLIDTLISLGITEVFDANKADFRGISEGGRLAVDVIKHMATIEVNEKGSEAAAVTIVGVVTKTLLISQTGLVFNHPFLFFIRHNVNGQILFIGEVNKL